MAIYLDGFKQRLYTEYQRSSYSRLAKEYGINPWYVWEILNDPKYRPPLWVKRKLGWVNPRPRRIAIRCDDMHSAAQSITNNLPPEKVRELIEELDNV